MVLEMYFFTKLKKIYLFGKLQKQKYPDFKCFKINKNKLNFDNLIWPLITNGRLPSETRNFER